MHFGVGKISVAGYATRSRPKNGANAFAYPFEYPKRMTDWGRYAKNSACTHTSLREVLK
jgi:hypothetical protein